MRIIGGKWGGRALVAPRGDAVRPTSDRVREALFNVLGALDDADVLDICAGTGAIGLEALSRGATAAVAIEQDRHALRAIAANAASLGAGATHRVVALDLRRALPTLAAEGRRFHLIFCDPPWARAPELGRLVLEAARQLLAEGGTVVLEHAARDVSPEPPAGLALGQTRRYGDTALSFYELEPGAPE